MLLALGGEPADDCVPLCDGPQECSTPRGVLQVGPAPHLGHDCNHKIRLDWITFLLGCILIF